MNSVKVDESRADRSFVQLQFCQVCKERKKHQVVVFPKGNRIVTCLTCLTKTKLKGGRP